MPIRGGGQNKCLVNYALWMMEIGRATDLTR